MGEEDPMTVEDVMKLIDDQAVVYFASIDGNVPRVRPVTMVRFDSRYFILTGSNDAKIDQIRNNNMVELCYPLSDEKGNGYIRLDGFMDIIDDMKLKAEVADHTNYFKEYWETPEDPTYTLLEFKMNNMEYMKPGDIMARKFKNIG